MLSNSYKNDIPTLYNNIEKKIESSYNDIFHDKNKLYDIQIILSWKNQIIQFIKNIFYDSNKNKDNHSTIKNITNENNKNKKFKNVNYQISQKENEQNINYYNNNKIPEKKNNEIDPIHQTKINIVQTQNNKYKKNNVENNEKNLKKDDEESNNLYNKDDYYTSKDIEIKYKEIINYFEINSANFFNDEDEKENQTIGEYLIEIANISRISNNDSNQLLKILYEEFDSLKNKNKVIIYSPYQLKMEFSSWVKNNNQIINKKIEDFLKTKTIDIIIKQKEQNKKDIFYKLYKELLILYFQCELSFPSIEINFDLNKDEDFVKEKMFDYVRNKGKKKKVNFVFFPSLKSNENYLKNGNQWVFTYIKNKNLFYFKDVNLEPLLEEKNKFYIPKLKDKLNLKFNIKKRLIPYLNYEISEKPRKEFIFHLKNKNTSEDKVVPSNSSIEIEENERLIKCDFILMNEKIISYEEI